MDIPSAHIPESACGEPAAAIRFLVEQLADTGAFTRGDVAAVVAGVLRREVLGSTAIGHEIALPHFKGDPVSAFRCIIGTAATPIRWPAATSDEEARVRRVVLMLAPATMTSADFLRVLEEVVRHQRGEAGQDGA